MLAGDEAKGEDGIDAVDDSFHGASVPHSAANSNPKFAVGASRQVRGKIVLSLAIVQWIAISGRNSSAAPRPAPNSEKDLVVVRVLFFPRNRPFRGLL